MFQRGQRLSGSRGLFPGGLGENRIAGLFEFPFLGGKRLLYSLADTRKLIRNIETKRPKGDLVFLPYVNRSAITIEDADSR